MKSQKPSRRMRRCAAATCFLAGVGIFLPAEPARAAERQFLVMLANSPKQFDGTPDDGLPNPQLIYDQYFDLANPDIASFAEYWEEISYGDVTISGAVTHWINLPWRITPDPDYSPEFFFDLNVVNGVGDGYYEYGRGEEFNNAYAAVPIDTTGDPFGADDGPYFAGAGTGSYHYTVRGDPVWKPGERFVDMDEDGRYDGLDEANNAMDWDGDAVADLRGFWTDLNGDGAPDNEAGCIFLTDSDNDGWPDCCPNGPSGAEEEDESGCQRFGFPGQVNGLLAPIHPGTCPATTWTLPNGEEFTDCNGNLIPDACDIDPLHNPQAAADCAALGWTGPFPYIRSWDKSPHTVEFTDEGAIFTPGPDGIPDECQYQNWKFHSTMPPLDGCATQLVGTVPPCFALEEMDPPISRAAVERCEYDDANGSDAMDIAEPFENFLRRWEPGTYASEASPPNRNAYQAHWVKVYDPLSPSESVQAPCGGPATVLNYGDDSYIRDNYPARPPDVEELVREAGGRLIFGAHDPYGKLPHGLAQPGQQPPRECQCVDGCECGGPGDYFKDGRQCIVDKYGDRFGIDDSDLGAVEVRPLVLTCVTDADCPAVGGARCVDGECRISCQTHDDCPYGLPCVERICVFANRYCVAGVHAAYDPPDFWHDAEAETPAGDQVYTTKMQMVGSRTETGGG